MKKWFLFFISFIFFYNNIHADFLTEISKRDRNNPIYITEHSAFVLYARGSYLHTAYLEDGGGVPSIVAYQINMDSIKLIIRIKTWDFAYRIYDYFYERDGIDHFTVDVHDYYLVELVYVNDKLETYCNRIRDINTNGFIYNDAHIGSNIKKVPQGTYHIYYSRHGMTLTEGMVTKIVSLRNERTDSLAQNSHATGTYDYYYDVLIEDKEFKINGYLLDFNNKIEYRSPILILRSGNTPQSAPQEEDSHYFGTWIYRGDGGMGMERFYRTVTITITADEYHFHYKGHENEYEYKLTDLKWTKIIRPDEDFRSYVEMLTDYYKGVSGYIITGKVVSNTTDWLDIGTMTEYVYIRQDNKERMFWYNSRISNYILMRGR